MIRHLLKLIWNERKTNGWIILEYIVVFSILWFCCDYLYFMTKSYMEPLGFDIKHVYQVSIGEKKTEAYQIEDIEELKEKRLEWGTTFMNRIAQHPDVESVGLTQWGLPYIHDLIMGGFTLNTDSLVEIIRVRYVSSGFFDVFKINLVSGRTFNWEDMAERYNVVITPDQYNRFGEYPKATHDVNTIKNIRMGHANIDYQVIGIAEKTKDAYYNPYKSSMYLPINKETFNLSGLQIAIRVYPKADKDFANRFTREMKEQLIIGPYYLSTVTSLEELRKNQPNITDQLNSVYAIIVFLVINIFLGIIGTFWYRTQSRRSEVGLRMALGATKESIKMMLFLETLLLLFISSIISINICLNISSTDLLSAMDIPVSNRAQLGSGIEQDIICYGITFLFLTLVSFLAVWYPAKQASDIPPAEALHEDG